MDTITLVDRQIEEGQILLDRLTAAEVAIKATWWVKPTDEDRWSLYVVTSLVDQMGLISAYRRVNDVRRSLGDFQITSSDIKLIGENASAAQEMIGRQDLMPGRLLSPTAPRMIGGIPVDEVYVYRLSKVRIPIYGTYFPPESMALSLSFEPDISPGSLIVEKAGTRTEFHAKTTEDCIEAPDGSALEPDNAGNVTLRWRFRGKPTHSNANEVWSLARLGLHGFRFVPKQDPNGKSSQQ
jgi:hypothetical protein